MIDFRYHLVSIIAVFFALAAGIVLGAGPLGETVDDTLADQTATLRDENRQLREDLAQSKADQEYQERFVDAVTPRLVNGELEGSNVAVVALPGAEDETVTAVRDVLTSAGATAELTVRIEPSWTDPDSEAVLDELATELVSSGTELPADADGFGRGATVLAAALMAPPVEEGSPTGAHETVDTATVTAFEESELIQLEQDASVAPSMAVLIAGSVSGDDAEQRLNRLAGLSARIDAVGQGAVVAGPAAIAESGLLSSMRDGDVADDVSTVDSVDLPSGRAAVVFALSEQASGETGNYGVVGETDGVLPPVPDTAPTDGATGSAEGNDAG
ncbi:copper transport outer membrane protein MctB [Haloactinopolyspora alba]|uniref:Copper transport outer membrane protein MctB n=1 Tax=Haloactinopolyspora alba TaxID=648780 RepID=A0A2P8E248_9ACTN|nr:copper transporter [Haloactinopolyspora alba]PSL03532.1 copper transport outer membrane protein MctB [Haloactinopolyspora alba]